MEATTDGSREPHADIANWLFGRLALVIGATTVVTAFPSGIGTVGSIVFALIVYLIALWLVVHLVFAALNDLLEAKLDEV